MGGSVDNPSWWGDWAEADQPRGWRSVRKNCTPCPIKALARLPRAPWENAPARSPNPGKCGNEQSYGKIQGNARGGRHGICGMPGGLARRHDGGPPVEGKAGAWGRTTRRNLLVGCVMAIISREKPPASTPYLAQRRDGALSPTIGCFTRHWLDPFARAKSSLLLMIYGPSERELADNTAN